MDSVNEIRAIIERIRREERIALVHPEDEERVTEVIAGIPHVRVKTSQFVPKGRVYLINERALEDY